MIGQLTLAVAAVSQEALVADLQNFLARVARNIVRLSSGHETLLIVIFVMLILIYLYLQKA
ncbi:MAG TPA: hypothetical protein VLA33_09215 [Gemmatimonadota bacterium]|nr:hypothetical protein [Gemmatimonadota bacterium]